MIPLLACSVCPACLTTYAKLFSVAGVGLGLADWQHDVSLALALLSSVVVSAWRSRKTGRVWPLALALLGSALVLTGHLREPLHVLEWAGVLTLLGGGLWEHFRLRGRPSTAAPSAPAAP